MTNILEEIVVYKREFISMRKRERSLTDVRYCAADCDEPSDFFAALSGEGMSLIAEIKKASPSKGVIKNNFDPEKVALAYARNGAHCLSVLTDEAYFQGSDAYIDAAKSVSGLPVLRKDFTLDEYQIYESRALGADAVLLIVSLMDGSQLSDFVGLALELQLTPLVEVHDWSELEIASASGARLIGINNRNLKTFITDLNTTFELLKRRPEGALLVSESGINNRQDVERLGEAGVDAMLVGESLMREDDMGAKVRELLGT
ncbi:MAG: indole-3-glycerol phosphate synthase TrpC [Candidatus Latescibacterota bacterium]|nr:indole-3-glycerol phosphate synthase TrpC [Candidatus Latescibacterota bacterium]